MIDDILLYTRHVTNTGEIVAFKQSLFASISPGTSVGSFLLVEAET